MTDKDISTPRAELEAKLASKPPVKSAPKPASKPAAKTKTRSGVGAPMVLLCSALAAAIGGAIGLYGPKLLDPANAAPAQAITRHTDQLKTLQATQDASGKTIRALQAQIGQIKQEQAQALAQLQDQNSGAQLRLEQATASLAALEESQAQARRVTAQRLDLIEGLISDAENPQAAPTELAKTLAELQGQIAGLKLAAATAEPVVISYEPQADSDLQEETDLQTGADIQKDAGPQDGTDLQGGTDVQDSRADVETAPEPSEDIAPPQDVAVTPIYDFSAKFPKAQMLAALTAQEQNTPKPGWLRRTLQKHVQTDQTPQINARAVINEAQALTRQGNIAAAADRLNTLNPTLRAAAYEWLTEARKLR